MIPSPGATPIPLLDPEQDAQVLRELSEREYATVLVVSDLHLGVGRDRWTQTYPLTENFFADDAFAELLRNYDAASTLLVLNGDTFDFLRITDTPDGVAALNEWRALLFRVELRVPLTSWERGVSGVEQKFGLRTDDYKSIWKLARILDGHEQWRQALMRWLAEGGRLVFVKGNHDLELHWRYVRRFLRDCLCGVGQGTAGEAELARHIGFAASGFTVSNVYIEHGHEYERMTRVDGRPTLPRHRSGELRLPLGSFVNRYFINRMERFDPFLDNIKPVHRALLALLRRRPVGLFRIYQGGWRFMLRALTRATTLQGATALLLLSALVGPLVVAALVMLWYAVPEFRVRIVTVFPFLQSGRVRMTGSIGGVSLPALLPYVIAVVQELLSQLGLSSDRDPLADGAVQRLREAFGQGAPASQLYAVMGHTHSETVRRLEGTPRPALYINTGTWIGQWPDDRLDLIGKFVYSVARFTRQGGEYAYDALVWDDEARTVRPARILVPA